MITLIPFGTLYNSDGNKIEFQLDCTTPAIIEGLKHGALATVISGVTLSAMYCETYALKKTLLLGLPLGIMWGAGSGWHKFCRYKRLESYGNHLSRICNTLEETLTEEVNHEEKLKKISSGILKQSPDNLRLHIACFDSWQRSTYDLTSLYDLSVFDHIVKKRYQDKSIFCDYILEIRTRDLNCVQPLSKTNQAAIDSFNQRVRILKSQIRDLSNQQQYCIKAAKN